jgi:hypothetical protein
MGILRVSVDSGHQIGLSIPPNDVLIVVGGIFITGQNHESNNWMLRTTAITALEHETALLSPQ